MAIIGTVRSLMRVPEASELVHAYLTADAAALATAYTVYLYRLDLSGSTATATILAAIDGAAASATAWAALRPKAMHLSTTRISLSPGDLLALSPWAGAISMRFRRLL